MSNRDWSHTRIHKLIDPMLDAYVEAPTYKNRLKLMKSARLSIEEAMLQLLIACDDREDIAIEFASQLVNHTMKELRQEACC